MRCLGASWSRGVVVPNVLILRPSGTELLLELILLLGDTNHHTEVAVASIKVRFSEGLGWGLGSKLRRVVDIGKKWKTAEVYVAECV